MILQPFGPLIYQETITNEHLEYLKDLAESSREHGQNVGDSLAGNIQEQFKIVGDSEKFNNFMYPHVFSYMESIMDRWEKHSINPGDTTIKELTYHYGRGPWINFQHKNEFNPVHVHTGDLSSVVMIDIPEEIAAEEPVASNMPCAGQLEFIEGSSGFWCSGTHKVIPKTGDIFLFPNTLKHTVYPFKSDVERITMSFNIYDIKT